MCRVDPLPRTLVRFYNPDDYALVKWWQLNNEWKPDKGYGYDGSKLRYRPEAGDMFYRKEKRRKVKLYFPGEGGGDDTFEIFSFCAESRALALGAEISQVSGFHERMNLRDAPLGYDKEHYSHSKQFRSNIAAQWHYWNQVTKKCQLSQISNSH